MLLKDVLGWIVFGLFFVNISVVRIIGGEFVIDSLDGMVMGYNLGLIFYYLEVRMKY